MKWIEMMVKLYKYVDWKNVKVEFGINIRVSFHVHTNIKCENIMLKSG